MILLKKYNFTRCFLVILLLFSPALIQRLGAVDFEYYANPVHALSYPGFPEETRVHADGTFRTHWGDFKLNPSSIDDAATFTLTLKGRGRSLEPVLECRMNEGDRFKRFSAFAAVFPQYGKVAYKASTINLLDEFEIIKVHNMMNFISFRMSNFTEELYRERIYLDYSFGEGIPMRVDYQSTEFIYYDWKDREFGLMKDSRMFGEGGEVLFACDHELQEENDRIFFDIEIPPGKTTWIYFYLPYFPMDQRDALLHLEEPLIGRKLWFRVAWEMRDWTGDYKMSINLVTEQKAVSVLNASRIYLLECCIDHIGRRWILRANPFQYDQFYIRDGMHQVRALDLLGEHEMAEKCLDVFLESRTEEGRFASQPGQDDAHGMALYALGQHYRLTRNVTWAKRVFPKVKESVEWLMEYRDNGLLPASRIRDNEQVKNAHIVGHNLWALTGLEAAADLAEGAGYGEHAQKWRENAADYRRVLDKELQKSYLDCGWIPPSFEGMEAEAFMPGRFGMKYGFDWGNLVLVYPSGMLEPFDPRVNDSMNYFRKYYREGLFPYPERGYENQLHHYLSMDVTQTSLIRNEYEDVLNDFYQGYLLHTTATHAGCERLDRRSHDFIPTSNVTPHGAFAAKYIELFRNFFLREDGGTLHLCSFMAPAWFKTGVMVEDAPTRFGKISFDLFVHSEKRKARLQIRPPVTANLPYQPLQKYIFHAPPFITLKKAVCDGKELEVQPQSLHIPPSARSIDIQFQSGAIPEIDYIKTINDYKQSQSGQ